MIEKLLSVELENFQGHEHTVIDFSDGVTVLCGESNNGKTAILRGLNWLITNRPTGIGFVSHWAKVRNAKGAVNIAPDKKCMVKLTFTADGETHEVSRVRTATENKYVVDGTELSAVGSDVPADVASLLGIKAVNRQSQDDGYFFLTLSAGQMAASLNELVHLDTIDTAYGFAHRRKVETNVLLKEANLAQAEAKVKLNGLKHIPQMRDLYNEAKELGVAIDERTDTLEDIAVLIQNLTDVYKALDDAVPDVKKKISRMQALVEDLNDAKETQWEISDLLRKVDRAEEACNELPNPSETQIGDIKTYTDNIRKLCEKSEALDDLLNNYDRLEQALDRCNEELAGLEKDLPAVCPLCGAKIGECRHD